MSLWFHNVSCTVLLYIVYEKLIKYIVYLNPQSIFPIFLDYWKIEFYAIVLIYLWQFCAKIVKENTKEKKFLSLFLLQMKAGMSVILKTFSIWSVLICAQLITSNWLPTDSPCAINFPVLEYKLFSSLIIQLSPSVFCKYRNHFMAFRVSFMFFFALLHAKLLTRSFRNN